MSFLVLKTFIVFLIGLLAKKKERKKKGTKNPQDMTILEHADALKIYAFHGHLIKKQ